MLQKRSLFYWTNDPPFLAKTWPYIVILLLSCLLAWQSSHVQEMIRSWDVVGTRYLNSLVGRDLTFDLFLAVLNSGVGDKVIILLILLVFFLHIFKAESRREFYKRAAFWTWVGLVFVIVYQGQRLVEHMIGRPSPSYVLDDWNNLKKIYGMSVKVSNRGSYPSGHAAAYFFFGFMAMRRYRDVGYLLLSLGMLLSTARVITGAHWLTDIYLGSLPLALLISALAYETKLCRVYIFLELFYWILSIAIKNGSAKRRVRLRRLRRLLYPLSH